ncbi:hypothetical protein L218DRAFT_1077397 [Marasmius fiardii PR-910]|nr:hypothetical protein L218DRAFT_1077397 [Marasmius fiardii PR-910]
MLGFEQPNQQNPSSQAQPQQQPNQALRLRDDPPPINAPQPTVTSRSRKRKTPPDPSITQDNSATSQPGPQQISPQHVLNSHAPQLMHHHPYPPFPGPPPDFNPNHSPGMPPPVVSQPGPPPAAGDPQAQQQQQQQQQQAQQSSPGGTQSAGRALSNSKRAEQNRKAQRAFRERRDQHVKALESRSQLLDAALASADEANRRWEECRALVDQLRVENATLRAALNQHVQQLPLPPTLQPQPPQQLTEPHKEDDNKDDKK